MVLCKWCPNSYSRLKPIIGNEQKTVTRFISPSRFSNRYKTKTVNPNKRCLNRLTTNQYPQNSYTFNGCQWYPDRSEFIFPAIHGGNYERYRNHSQNRTRYPTPLFCLRRFRCWFLDYCNRVRQFTQLHNHTQLE